MQWDLDTDSSSGIWLKSSFLVTKVLRESEYTFEVTGVTQFFFKTDVKKFGNKKQGVEKKIKRK